MRFLVDNPYRITQGYHSRYSLDIAPLIAGTRGIPIRAPEPCVVVISAYTSHKPGWKKDNWMILKGKSTGMHYYGGHMEKRLVKTGDHIPEGHIVGIMGTTGKSTGIHLHTQVRRTRYSSSAIPQIAFYAKHGVKVASRQPAARAPAPGKKMVTMPKRQATRLPDGRFTYKVKRGDTLSKIARDILGDSKRWRDLGYTGDPAKLAVGQTLIWGKPHPPKPLPKAVAQEIIKQVATEEVARKVEEVKEKQINEALEKVESEDSNVDTQDNTSGKETVLVNESGLKPDRKVTGGAVGGAGGGGVAGALMVIIQERTGVDFSVTEVWLITFIFTLVSGAVTAYMTKRKATNG